MSTAKARCCPAINSVVDAIREYQVAMIAPPSPCFLAGPHQGAFHLVPSFHSTEYEIIWRIADVMAIIYR
jgi:hypothetical protein